MRLLLLSNSRNPGGGWLDHAEGEIRDFLGTPRAALLFFPFAAVTMSFDAYAAMARKRFARMGYRLAGAHRASLAAARTAAGFVVGGGNTFRLLDEMQRRGWLAAMGLVPFQLNPHYTERSLAGHGGEARDQRIGEFLALNRGVPVLGLREGSLLRREGARLELRLRPGARLFSGMKNRKAFKAGADLSFLLR